MKIYKDARKELFKNNTILRDTKDSSGKYVLDKEGNRKKTVGVDFKSFKWDKPKTLLFKNENEPEPRHSQTYMEVEISELENIFDYAFLFEVITAGMERKLFFDWDGKGSNISISYNDAEEISNCFKLFLKENYGINKEINCCIEGSVEKNHQASKTVGMYGVIKMEEYKSIMINGEIDENDPILYDENGEQKPPILKPLLFKSLHFIFNVYTKTNEEAKQIVNEFLNTHPHPYTEGKLIDRSVYSNMKLIRALGQRKNRPDRTDKLQVLNKWDYEERTIIQHTFYGEKKKEIVKETRKAISDYFITAINKETDILLEVEFKKITEQETITKHNMNFDIKQLDLLTTHIEKLEYDDLHYNNKTYKDEWRHNLNLIIGTLLACGVKWEDIKTHELIHLFLKISKERSKANEYNNAESFTKNVNFINDLCDKKIQPKVKSDKFFTILTEEEKAFIYKYLKMDISMPLNVMLRTINNKVFLDINNTDEEYDNKKKSNLVLYDTSKYILLINCKIENKVDINNNTKTVILTKEQHHFQLDYIASLPKHTFTEQKSIDFKDWSEVETNTSENSYYEAPVGSRKSSLRMDLDIKAILDENPNNRIVMICDTINLSKAQEARVKNIIAEKFLVMEDDNKDFIEFKKFKDNDGNSMEHIFIEQNEKRKEKLAEAQSYIKHYLDYEKTHYKLTNENTRILITTYDSLNKYGHLTFTHVLLDEYLNIRKRFTKMSGDNRTLNDRVNEFFNILKKANCVKCYDADLKKQDLKLLQKYSNKKFVFYKLIEYKQKNNSITLMNYKKQKNEVLKSVMDNKNITISCNTKREAEELFEFLLTAKKDIKMVIITGGGLNGEGGAKTTEMKKNSKKLKYELVSNTALWENYQVVIYTPTIMTGISFDKEGYFYRHYAFICGATTDYTQTAQMLFRTRNTITHDITVCDINDNINSCYNFNNIKHNIKLEYYYDTMLINIQQKNANLPLWKNEEFKQKQTIIKKYEEIDFIEEKQRNQFYYDLFYTLYKWGCDKVKCEFYNFIDETDYEYKRTEEVEYSHKNFITIDNYDEFLMLEFVEKIDRANEKDEDDIKDPNILKTLRLRKYGYGLLLFNKYKNEDLFNKVVYDFYTNYSEFKIYDRLKELTYYNLRELIYTMVNKCYVGINDLGELFLKQNKFKEQGTFLNWLVNSFVFFKLCDFHGINAPLKDGMDLCYNYETIMNKMLMERSGTIRVCKNTICEELKPLIPLINLLVNKKIRDNATDNLSITEAFNYFKCFNTRIEQVDKTNMFDISFKRRGNIIRYETKSYYIEKGEHLLTSTDYDDFINWFNDEDPIYYKTNYGRNIKTAYLPKMKMFNYYSESKGVNERLRHFINTYYDEANSKELLEILQKRSKEEFDKQIKITAETAEEIWRNRNKEAIPLPTTSGIGEAIISEEPSGIDLKEGEEIKNTNIEGYLISNYGRVFYEGGDTTHKEIKTHILQIPYNKERTQETFNVMSDKYDDKLSLNVNCVMINQAVYFVEKLVAEAFINTYRNDYFIKHNNNIYTDDRASNLIIIEKWDKSAVSDLFIETEEEKALKTVVNEEKKKVMKEKRKTEKINCPYCNKDIVKINIAKHKNICKKKPTTNEGGNIQQPPTTSGIGEANEANEGKEKCEGCGNFDNLFNGLCENCY